MPGNLRLFWIGVAAAPAFFDAALKPPLDEPAPFVDVLTPRRRKRKELVRKSRRRRREFVKKSRRRRRWWFVRRRTSVASMECNR